MGGLALEGVLDLLASLLEVALGLVGLALGLQLLVVGHAAGGLLGLSFEFFGLVLGLVVKPHRCLLGCRVILVLCSRAAAAETAQPVAPGSKRGVVPAQPGMAARGRAAVHDCIPTGGARAMIL